MKPTCMKKDTATARFRRTDGNSIHSFINNRLQVSLKFIQSSQLREEYVMVIIVLN
jgi:hypothetical protein